MKEDGYVKNWLFRWVIGGIVSAIVLAAGWFATDTKQDLMEIKESQKGLKTQIDDINRRTAFLEGLTSSQKQTFKTEVDNLLGRMFKNK